MFSLSSFIFVIKKAINNVKRNWNKKNAEKTEGNEEDQPEQKLEMTDEELDQRILELVEMITSVSWDFLRRGLFDKHKVVVIAILCFRIMVKKDKLPRDQ